MVEVKGGPLVVLYPRVLPMFPNMFPEQCQADSKMPYENKKGKKSILGSKLEFSA